LLGAILLASAIAGMLFVYQGNILSVLCNKSTTISAGASGIIFGVIGAYLAFMTINWQTLGQYG
jgi:membrane associated rhomboid family serine protease